MALSRGDVSYGKTITKMAKAHVLVIDDLGLAPMTDTERRDLLEVVRDGCMGLGSRLRVAVSVARWGHGQ